MTVKTKVELWQQTSELYNNEQLQRNGVENVEIVLNYNYHELKITHLNIMYQ